MPVEFKSQEEYRAFETERFARISAAIESLKATDPFTAGRLTGIEEVRAKSMTIGDEDSSTTELAELVDLIDDHADRLLEMGKVEFHHRLDDAGCKRFAVVAQFPTDTLQFGSAAAARLPAWGFDPAAVSSLVSTLRTMDPGTVIRSNGYEVELDREPKLPKRVVVIRKVKEES